MAHRKYNDLTKRTQSDKVLKHKALKIASNQRYGGYQRGLALMVFFSFLIKNLQAVILNLCQISNNLQMNCINQLLGDLKKEKFILH